MSSSSPASEFPVNVAIAVFSTVIVCTQLDELPPFTSIADQVLKITPSPHTASNPPSSSMLISTFPQLSVAGKYPIISPSKKVANPSAAFGLTSFGARSALQFKFLLGGQVMIGPISSCTFTFTQHSPNSLPSNTLNLTCTIEPTSSQSNSTHSVNGTLFGTSPLLIKMIKSSAQLS